MPRKQTSSSGLQSGLLAFPTGSSLPKPEIQFSGVLADSLYHCAMVEITAAGPRRIRTVFRYVLQTDKSYFKIILFYCPVKAADAALQNLWRKTGTGRCPSNTSLAIP